jgi:hypothetical protein
MNMYRFYRNSLNYFWIDSYKVLKIRSASIATSLKQEDEDIWPIFKMLSQHWLNN